VFVHDGSGTLHGYRELIAELSDQGSFFGLAVNDPDGYVACDAAILVRSRCADYARLLLSEGLTRVHMIGRHFGGLLATEVARNLIEAGAEVKTLTIISSYPLPCVVDDELVVEYLFALGLGANLATLGLPSEAAVGRALSTILLETPDRIPAGRMMELAGDSELDDLATAFRSLVQRNQSDRLEAIRRATTSIARTDEAHALKERYEVFRHSLRAAALHKMVPYVGGAILLLHHGHTALWPSLQDDMTVFWRSACLGGLRLIDVPGDHFSCMQAPHVVRVAEVIATESRRAQDLPGSSVHLEASSDTQSPG
jgi:L-cysteine---[L-cysteinyl-carrier protein] ligase PchF